MTLTSQELARIVDSLFDHVLVLGRDFRVEAANRPFAEALGYTDPAEVTGKHCYELFHGTSHPCKEQDVTCPLALVLKSGKPVTLLHRHRDCKGNPVHAEVRAVPLDYQDGRVTRVAEVIRDVTTERDLQERLGKSIEESRQVLEMGGDGILVLDPQYRIRSANRTASDLLDVPVKDLGGMDLTRFLEKQDRGFLEGMCAEVQKDEGKCLSTELRIVKPSGEKRDLQVHISATGHAGERRIYARLRDITHRKRVEQKLLEATRKFQKIAEMGEDAILVLSDTYEVEFANSMASELTGYTSKELMGLDFLSVLQERDRGFLVDFSREGAETAGRRICTQMELKIAHGKSRSCEVCISAASFEEGNRKTYVYIRDLSERLRIERQVREANEFLSNLIESSTDGIIAADLKGTVIIFNRGAEQLLGYRSEEVIGTFNAANFYPPGVGRQIMRMMRSEEYGGRGRLLPHRIIGLSKNGEHIPISLSGALIYQDGREVASVGIFSDLRQILKAEEELLESEAKFRDLFETVRHGLYFSSREGKFLDCNQAMVEMLGYPNKEEVLALDLAKDLYMDPSHRLEFQRMIEAEGYVKDYEVRYKRKIGDPITVLLTAQVRKHRAGRVLGYQGLLVDITERRKLEQQLFESEKLAAMGRLTAQIAHELNNPIYGIMNCLDLLKSEVPESSKKRRFLEMAASETKRISELLRGMLSFFRPDEDVKTLVDLNKIIEEVVLFVGKQLQEFKIKVVLDLQDAVPKIFASGNQMKQVLLNLIMNAKAAMRRGGTLTITSRSADAQVMFSVSDTGTGIPPEIRHRIFEAFFTTKNDVKGVGLGLSVCFGIIRQHSGKIEVASEMGVGSTFTVTLPLQS